VTDYGAAISGDLFGELKGTQGPAITVTNPAPDARPEELSQETTESVVVEAEPEAPEPEAGPEPTETETPPAPEPWARPRRRRKRDGERWVDLHTRRTFILPNDLSADIDEVVGTDEDLSFASAATEAFTDWVAKRRRLARKMKGAS
jgi:hypothetical protein